MSKNSKNKLLLFNLLSGWPTGLKSGLLVSVLASLGLLPSAAKAQSVEVTQALDTPIDPVDEAEPLEAVAPGVELKTRAVKWDVPWIEPESVVAADYEPVAPLLTQAFEQEAAIAQSAQNDYPLIVVDASNAVEPSTINDEPVEDLSIANPNSTLLSLSPKEDVETEEDEEEETQTLIQEESPLIAIAPTPEKQDFNTIAPLIAIAAPEAPQAEQKRDPWLATTLPGYEAPLETEVAEDLETIAPLQTIAPQLALAPEATDDEEEKRDELRIALGLDAEEDGEKKTPWLARRLLIDNNGQVQEDPNAPRLAVNLPRREAAKRPAAWISLTPRELIEPDSDDVAIIDSTLTPGVSSYDVSGIQQISITPADLATGDEIAVSANASDIEFLSPAAGAFLDIPATSVVLRFPIGANIALLTNGHVVDASLVGRTETDPATQLRTQTWYGVPLLAGENVLEVISTETGDVLQSLPLTVRGLPDRLVLLSPQSIPSDGRSTATIRGQLVDEIGNISRWDSVATLRSSDGQFIGADHDPDMPGYQVEIQRGEFAAELQSSLESHLVQIQASANGFDAFSQVQFDTPQRPHLISGVIDLRIGARGTDFYDSFREFLPEDGNNDYEFDVDAAVFATGNLGEWLYTGAYNSDRTLNENCRGETTLFRSGTGSDCNSYATYGDDSYTDTVAPSLDSVYLRLERNSPSNDRAVDYAMWGDFNTSEFSTSSQLFTATNRQLHGFKTNYNFGNLAITGLYANNVEGFQRDTIVPDGTSGFYFTSERNLVPGSENVYIELEELERPGTVLDRKPLYRGADYEIDYDRGTILFNDPVTRTSVDDFGLLLVRRIVTTYQHEDGDDTDILAGRLQYNLNQRQGSESWIGASYFTEDQGTRDFTLYGADARIALGDSAQVIAEIAQSSSDFAGTDEVSGTGYRVTFDGSLGTALNGRAYYRSTDAGFTNTATTSFVPGQTRYGAEISSRLGRNTSLRARYDHEDNTGNAPRVITDVSDLLLGLSTEPGAPLDNSLTTYSLGLSQRLGRATAEVDWLHRDRTDRINNDRTLSSDQLRTRLTTPITRKLSLVAQNELNLSSNVDPIYPSRTLIGLNWEVMPWLNVSANQIFYGGGGNSRGNATSIDVTGDHTFATDTTVRGRFSTVDGRQIGGTIGLEQGINLAPGLDLDLGYEKVFSTLGNETAASTQFAQPFATGNRAAALGLAGGESYSVGLSYTDNPDFQASTRFEHRSSRRGTSNTVFTLSALGRVTPSLTLLGDYRAARAANQRITGLGTTSILKLGMAYRNPRDDRFNGLLRYEHRLNPNSIPTNSLSGTNSETQEHVFSAEGIYAPNWRWELYGKYALRHSRSALNVSDNNFSSSSTVQLAQARATYRLGYRWDTVGELRWIGGSGFNETGYSLEAGYYPLPDLRVSAGYSGGANDSDFGENRDAGGFYFGMTAKLSGLLNGFGTQPAAPQQQEESVIQVSEDADGSAEAQTVSSTAPAAPVNENYPTATDL